MLLGEQFLRRALQHRRLGQLGQVARYQPQQQALDLQEALACAGPAFVVANACASGANALGHAADWIRAGRAPCVLAGGFEALSELIFVGFDCLQAASPDACRPFDATRNGLMLGEAAAFVVLESLEHAQARGAKPLARLSGYGHTTDLHHLTQPAPDGRALTEALRQAFAQAGLSPDAAGYFNAHGTGTPANDGIEAASIRAFFGDAPALRVSSTKACHGHTLGAAGALEAVLAILALSTGGIPPQANLRQPLPEIAAALANPGESRAGLRAAVSANLGFGGSNAVLVFSAV